MAITAVSKGINLEQGLVQKALFALARRHGSNKKAQ